MTSGSAREGSTLRASIYVGGALGVLGVVWGLASTSQMILLDGAFAVVGIVLSALLLRASTVSRAAPDRRYHYGRHGSTPLAIGLQGLTLLGTLLYAALDAVATIRQGGSDVAPGWATLYGVVVTVASLAVWWWMRGRAGGSDVLSAEATAWRVAALRGVGMVLGFSFIWVAEGTAWDAAVPYVDPAMVLATCIAFAPAPLRMVHGTVSELMERAPSAAIQEPVLRVVERLGATYGLGDLETRLAKVGPRLYVEVEGSAPPDTTIALEHEARERLRADLEAVVPYDVWLTFELIPPSP